MNGIFFTDMDGTILENGKCDVRTKETLDGLTAKKAVVVLTTGKGLPRIDASFQTSSYGHKILENGARLLVPGHNQVITSIEGEHLIALEEIFDKIQERIFFLFFYPIDAGVQSGVFYIQNVDHKKLQKFKEVMTPKHTFTLSEFPGYLQEGVGITMMNICVGASSLEELGLPSIYKGLNLVFNEGMLNISVSDKGIGIEKMLQRVNNGISKVLVAGNDMNDIPAFDRVNEIATQPMVERAGIIVVGDIITENVLRKYRNTASYRVSSPADITSPINDFFSK